MLKNKKILVAGALGLLGSTLVIDLLKKGNQVIATDVFSDKNKEDNLRISSGIENHDALEFHILDIN